MEDKDNEKLLNDLKDLDDMEFGILFIDAINKKLKQLVYKEVRTSTSLFMVMSIVDTIKKYKQLAEESNRSVPHIEVIDLILNKAEDYLKSVAADETKAPYVAQVIKELNDITKELMFTLKSELVNTPKYEYLKPKLQE